RYHYYVTAARVHGDPHDAGSLSRIGAPIIDALVVDHVSAVLRCGWRPGDAVAMRTRAALRKVVLGRTLVTLQLDAQACRNDATGVVSIDEHLVELSVPISLKHRQSATLLATTGGPPAPLATPDRSMVRAA